MNESLLQAVDDERIRLAIPGAVVLVSSPALGEVTRGFGVADVVSAEPLSVESVLRVGSITKTIVATTVLQLVADGLLSLDDEARRHVPTVPVPAGVTIRRLLGMTSGIADYTSDAFVGDLVSHPDRMWTPGELLKIAFRGAQRFEPGSSWEYNNAGYILLGLVVEAVAGARLEEVARERVFEPLGLRATALPAPTPGVSPLPDPRVRGYHRRGDDLIDATEVNPSWAWAAGGVVSTVRDLRVLIEAIVRGDLLPASLHAQRLRMRSVAEGVEYGLGIADFGGMRGHNGEQPGFQSFAGHDLRSGTTLVVLTNVDGGTADALAAFIRSTLASGASSP